MKLFVTGASGFIGSEVVKELIANGHEVSGLVRSDEGAAKVKALGAEVVRGDLTEPETLVEAAKKADGTLHLGMVHDFANFAKLLEIDRVVIAKISDAYIGTNKVFVNTGGTLSIAGIANADEDTVPTTTSGLGNRLLNEKLALSYASKGVRSVAIRLSPTVHDVEDKAFIPIILSQYESHGTAYYQGNGLNEWAAVHRLDAARLYRLAAEKAPAGTILNGVGESGVAWKDIAGALAKKYSLKVESVDDLTTKLGPLYGYVASLDNHVSFEKTKKLLGWEPKEIGLLEDISKNY